MQNLKDKEWLDQARVYATKLLGKRHGYLIVFEESNIDAWRDYIDDGYSPQDAVLEDLSYMD